MKKNLLIGRGVVVAMGILLSHSMAAERLNTTITPQFKDAVVAYYDSKGEGEFPDHYFLLQPNVRSEYYAFEVLLPKFFEIVKTEANKPYWFWKTDYKKSDWWKALDAKDGVANKFMAYLYNINDESAKKKSGITVSSDKKKIYYSFPGNTFHEEPISFFRRHWGKIALAGVLAAGVGYTGYRYKDQITPTVGRGWSSVRQGAGNLYSGVTGLPGRVRGGYNRWRTPKSPTDAEIAERMRQNKLLPEHTVTQSEFGRLQQEERQNNYNYYDVGL